MFRLVCTFCVVVLAFIAPAAATAPPTTRRLLSFPFNVTAPPANYTGDKLADLAQFKAEISAVLHEAVTQNKADLENFLNRTKIELAEEREEWGTEHNTKPGDLPLNKLVRQG